MIATAASRRQSNAIASEIDQEMKKLGEAKLGLEGSEEGRWILIDYGDFVVHIFSPEARAYYALEEIWGDAPRLDWQARRPSEVRPARSPDRGRRLAPSDRTRSDECTRATADSFGAGLARGGRPRGLRHGRAPGDRPQVRRLPGQRLHGAGQGARARTRATSPQEVARRRRPGPDGRPARGRRPRLPQRPLDDDWIAAGTAATCWPTTGSA